MGSNSPIIVFLSFFFFFFAMGPFLDFLMLSCNPIKSGTTEVSSGQVFGDIALNLYQFCWKEQSVLCTSPSPCSLSP